MFTTLSSISFSDILWVVVPAILLLVFFFIQVLQVEPGKRLKIMVKFLFSLLLSMCVGIYTSYTFTATKGFNIFSIFFLWFIGLMAITIATYLFLSAYQDINKYRIIPKTNTGLLAG